MTEVGAVLWLNWLGDTEQGIEGVVEVSETGVWRNSTFPSAPYLSSTGSAVSSPPNWASDCLKFVDWLAKGVAFSEAGVSWCRFCAVSMRWRSGCAKVESFVVFCLSETYFPITDGFLRNTFERALSWLEIEEPEMSEGGGGVSVSGDGVREPSLTRIGCRCGDMDGG